MTELQTIQQKLIDMLNQHPSSLKVTANTPEKFEVSGTIKTMLGKKEVDGIYFASVVPKPKDVRFYFFPTYTHREQIGKLPENLQKALKGKSCFHIKSMDAEFEKNINDLIHKAVKLYQADGLLAR